MEVNIGNLDRVDPPGTTPLNSLIKPSPQVQPMEWQEVGGNWLLIPRRPRAVIHFLGGALVAAAPQVTYRRLLEVLARSGYLVVATPLVNNPYHQDMAREALASLERTLAPWPGYLPVYGLGHSMGCKLHLLIGSLLAAERAGNIFLAFNNFPAQQAVPWIDKLGVSLPLEFTPDPAATLELARTTYRVSRNLLVKFRNDDLDQTDTLYPLLQGRFPGLTTLQCLPGHHLTPLGPDLPWVDAASFSPLDVLTQWLRQEVYGELERLEKTILTWLAPGT